MKIKLGGGQTARNIAVNITAFVIQLVISFVISPIIIGKVGVTAHGFVGIANNFVSYAMILTVVFNSVAARFISKAFYEEQYDQANSYYNSLIVANVYIAVILGIIGAILVPNLARVILIPEDLVFDVQITFALVFGTYIISVLSQVFTVATFVTNRSDLEGIRNVISQLIRLLAIILFLNFLTIKIYWVAFASLLSGLTLSFMNVGLTKKLTPELKINLKQANMKDVWTLACSGAWVALGHISVILTRNCDLIIVNQAIGSHEMGLLSVAQTIPSYISQIICTVGAVFVPVFMNSYCNESKEQLVDRIKQSVKTMACLFFVPIIGFAVYSQEFYALWQSSLAADEIRSIAALSTIAVVQYLFDASTYTIGQVCVVANKLKMPMIFNVISGVCNIGLVLLLLKTTSLGVWGIVLSGTAVLSLRFILFNSLYVSRILDCGYGAFWGTLLKTWGSIPLLIGVLYGVKLLIPVSSWVSLIASALVAAIAGYVMMIVLYERGLFAKIGSTIRKCFSQE